MTKAVGYVGTDGGVGAAAGAPSPGAADAQRGRIWAWCKAHGMPLDDIHAETDPLAPGRPGLEAALAAATGGTLVVDTVSALAGSVPDLARVAGRLHDGGTRLVALSEALDTAADPEGVAARMLRAAAALAFPAPAEAAFGFAPAAAPEPAAPEGPGPAPYVVELATPPDEAAIATLLGTVLGPPPEPLDDPGDGFRADPMEDPIAAALRDPFSEPLAAAPEAPEPAPAWGDLPLDAGVGGFGATGADEPDAMRIPLEQIEDAVAAADTVAGLAEAADALPGAPHPPHRALRAVSPLRGDLVPVDAPPEPGEPVPPPMRVAPEPPVPTYGAGTALTRARHRRESDYAATAENASRYLQKNKLEKAAAVWTEFLRGAEGNNAGRGWNHLGDIHVRAHRNVAAADAFLKAAQAFEAAHYNHMAVATLKKVIKLDPGRPEVYRSLAELNARCDRVGDAVEAYLRYARFLQDAGRLAEALEMFCRIRILDPVNARHRLQLADELFAFGFEGEAAREAVHAADLLLERGDQAAAQDHLARWAERIPGHAGLALRLTAMAGGDAPIRVPPAAGIEGGVLLTSGGSGRSRADDPGWHREASG